MLFERLKHIKYWKDYENCLKYASPLDPFKIKKSQITPHLPVAIRVGTHRDALKPHRIAVRNIPSDTIGNKTAYKAASFNT